MTSSFEKVILDLATDIDMLIMVAKNIREGICNSVYQYAKPNNKYMKDYDENKKSLYIQCWDVNNLYGWTTPQKLPADNFEWIKDTSQFNEDFIKKYNEENNEGYFLKVDVQYFEKLHGIHDDLPLLPEIMKIEKVEKLVANLHDKTEYFRHIKKFKTSIKLWINFKKNFMESLNLIKMIRLNHILIKTQI